MVYAFTGDGKGKTSAALGVALRTLLLGKKVVWISWFKSESWGVSEMKLPTVFKDTLKMYWAGKGFYIKNGEVEKREEGTVKKAKTANSVVYDDSTVAEHKKSATMAVELALKILDNNEADLLVLDEIMRAVSDELIMEKEVLKLLERRQECHLVMTGHDCSENLASKVDLLTEMKKIKHPYDLGILAVRGLDF